MALIPLKREQVTESNRRGQPEKSKEEEMEEDGGGRGGGEKLAPVN